MVKNTIFKQLVIVIFLSIQIGLNAQSRLSLCCWPNVIPQVERYNNSFMEELNIILGTETKNPILKQVVVNAVKITNDLSFAKVYFTVLDDTKKIETLKALKQASGFIRSKLCERIDIRHMPELDFIYDESIAYGKLIEDKIKEIHEKEIEE